MLPEPQGTHVQATNCAGKMHDRLFPHKISHVHLSSLSILNAYRGNFNLTLESKNQTNAKVKK
jgi:hypothetical protein